MAKGGSSHEECSLLLRMMELQDSDDELEVQELGEGYGDELMQEDTIQMEATLIWAWYPRFEGPKPFSVKLVDLQIWA